MRGAISSVCTFLFTFTFHPSDEKADETQGVQVNLRYPLTVRAIPERLRDVSYV